MADKLRMLTVDELRMDEVAIVERMSGYSLSELNEHMHAPPTSLVMALAFVTERRQRPQLKPETYNSLTPQKFIERLYANFQFDQSDSNYEAWTVRDLKLELGKRDLDTKGNKPVLAQRLAEADAAAGGGSVVELDPTKAV